MGLFRRGDDGGRRFVMREKLLSIGDDFWIRDDDGNKVFKVNGKALRVRKTLVLEDDSGNELVHIQDRVLNLRGTMKLERDGEDLATVHKALIGTATRARSKTARISRPRATSSPTSTRSGATAT